MKKTYETHLTNIFLYILNKYGIEILLKIIKKIIFNKDVYINTMVNPITEKKVNCNKKNLVDLSYISFHIYDEPKLYLILFFKENSDIAFDQTSISLQPDDTNTKIEFYIRDFDPNKDFKYFKKYMKKKDFLELILLDSLL